MNMFKTLFKGIAKIQKKIKLDFEFPPDFDQEIITTINYVQNYTMTSPERIFSLCQSVKYIVANQIPGDIVECGVWKGGSMMAVAKTLMKLNNCNKDLYLFDTFEGMTKPSQEDIDYKGLSASKFLLKYQKSKNKDYLCYASLEEVKEAMEKTGYDINRVHFIKGKVEETIPSFAPEAISILRLDTDWYESTKHELNHLFPRIVHGGVLIIDDYGHWQGSRQAVDEYIEKNQIKILLNRIDYTGRIGIVLKNQSD